MIVSNINSPLNRIFIISYCSVHDRYIGQKTELLLWYNIFASLKRESFIGGTDLSLLIYRNDKGVAVDIFVFVSMVHNTADTFSIFRGQVKGVLQPFHIVLLRFFNIYLLSIFVGESSDDSICQDSVISKIAHLIVVQWFCFLFECFRVVNRVSILSAETKSIENLYKNQLCQKWSYIVK